jgi:hypothetical protein
MRVPQRRSVVTSLVLLGLGVTLISGPARAQSESTPKPPESQSPPPLDGPTTDLAPIPSVADAPRTPSATAEDEGRMTTRETLPAPGELADSRRVRVRKAPPAPIIERPSGPRPDRRAQWIAGHWGWEASRDDFVWVGGSWQIPPAGSTWVAGRWRHDAAGWYWVSGAWSRTQDRSAAAANVPAWRTTGPPEDHPGDTPAPAPGPDFFFVPGHYAPTAGDRLAWTSGFWARVQPGWDWIPARWVRRPNGWDFREGHWVRDPDTAVVDTGPRGRRRFAARPLFSGRRPAVVESEPGIDRPPPPSGTVTERDPIAEAEAADRLAPPDGASEIIVGPVPLMPYYVIRPPGSYPYGPNGVVVPGAVPPFVRRLLDRVLP